jgi:hypothetical protein
MQKELNNRCKAECSSPVGHCCLEKVVGFARSQL